MTTVFDYRNLIQILLPKTFTQTQYQINLDLLYFSGGKMSPTAPGRGQQYPQIYWFSKS